MRPDQSASQAAAERRHATAYAHRWMAVRPWIVMALGNGSSITADSVERYEGFRRRHQDRLVYLHQSLAIPMKIIARWMLDDPRLTEPQMRERLRAYRERKQVYDSMKRKRENI